MPLAAQGLIDITFTSSDTTPDPGQSITLTASVTSYADGLEGCNIYDLGSGNSDGQSGGTSIATGFFNGAYTGSMSTSFTIPSGTAAGSYTFRAYAEDEYGLGESAWLVVTVQSPAPANTAPTVSISASSTSITAGQSVTITATASDTDGTISNVKFYRNSALAKTDTTSSYTYTYSNATAGSHSFYAVATDNDGATGTSTTVTVSAANVAPTVSISASSTSITAGQSVTITATASDTDGTISNVKFYRNSALAETDTSSPYTYIYSNAAAGSHSFYAIATDDDGATGTSNTVTVPNTPPTVTLSARATTIEESGSTILTASASDTDGTIVTYAFYRGSALLQSGPLPTYKFNNPTAGGHRFTVTVTDDGGATATSGSVLVLVNPTAVQWADANGDGLYDEVLATLEIPSTVLTTVTVNGIGLWIETYLGDLGLPAAYYVSIRVPASLTPVGFNYQLQSAFSGGPWQNAGPQLPGSTNGIFACPSGLAQEFLDLLPDHSRVVRLAKASHKIGSLFQADFNGDGFYDNVQEVSYEVRAIDNENGELIIVVDCPEDVIGCANPVVELDGGWTPIAQAGNGITEVLSTAPAYPCEDTPNDCTTDSRVYRIDIGIGLNFGFAAPTNVAVGLEDINDHANTSDDVTITPWNTVLPITDNNIAWIDAHTSAQNAAPRMPQLEFQIRGQESGVALEAKLAVQYNRGNDLRSSRNQTEDTVKIPSNGAYTRVTGDTWEIWRSYQTARFFGGDATLTYRLTRGTQVVLAPQTIKFRIGGENPDDMRCKTYIQAQTDAGSTGNLWFAYAIAKHETKAQNSNNLYYNQFYELPRHVNDVGRPVWGPDDDRLTGSRPGGYGIFQITVDNIPREQIWDWQENVKAGLMILRSKRSQAVSWMSSQRLQAGNTDPPSHTVSGVQFADGTNRTMVDAVTMKAFNGASRPNFDKPDSGTVVGFILDPHSSDHYCYWRTHYRRQDDPSDPRWVNGTVVAAPNPGWALSRLNNGGRNYVQLICVEVD